MKSILLIGLGRFGRHIAIKLNELGHEVMAVDHDEERVNAILPYVTNTLKGRTVLCVKKETGGARSPSGTK